MAWHKILERQLRRIGINPEAIPENVHQLLDLVSGTYTSADEDRKLMERSFDLSSKELDERTSEVKHAYERLDELVKERTKQLEQEKAALLAIGDGTLTVDANGKITFANKAFKNILGWELEEVKGQDFEKVMPLEDESGKTITYDQRPIRMALQFDTTKNTKSITASSYYYVRKDKTRVPVAIVVSPIIIENKVVGAVEIFRDISEEKVIEKAKIELVSLVSHQLRTPLTAISWYTEMLLANDLEKITDKQKKYINEVNHGSHRMVELVNAFLDVSRIELGTFLVEPELVNLTTLLDEVLAEQKPQIVEKKLKVKNDFAKNIPVMELDKRLLWMIFQNLISNAVKYTPEGGDISITVDIKNTGENFVEKDIHHKSLCISVSDTGYGIPKDAHNKIFTKLFRADNVRKKDTDGTGLGLYIVKSMIEQAGGEIWFKSEENKGTVFYICFPLTEATGAACAV